MFASTHSFFTEHYIVIGVLCFLINVILSVRSLIKNPLSTAFTKSSMGNFWYYSLNVLIWSLVLLICVSPIWSGYFLIFTIVSFFATVKSINLTEQILREAK